ncbi:hypothetical protein BJ166DRAFT_594944 [Pestalotiopsis sp. NC0098]|nr:hypothetical protein BJ166DRAFT_594944 [Pestalotiopsis sp. NC0098]
MASVSSLDKDLRMSRNARYTPAAANEVKSWIEGVLGEKLAGSDLLDGLKDGVALCKLVNLAIGPPGVKFKKSAMPFVQMENISHYLRACKSPPLNLPDHDMFLTVDLFEKKDPAQVLQCLGAFSRAAEKANPSSFPTSIGGIGSGSKPRNGVMSPDSTGTPGRARAHSNASQSSSTLSVRPAALVPHKTGSSTGSGRWGSTNKSPTSERVGSPSVSSWSKKFDEGSTSPAWNIAQYGYMGGASQGNLGIAFGGRRQITSAGPHVPNLADKERRRKQQEADAERQRQQMQEEEQRRKVEREAEEERIRLEEEKRWEQETQRQRDEEKRKAEDEKLRWQEEERQWRLTNEKRRQEEEAAEARIVEERRKSQSRSRANSQLQGQYLSQYQAEQGIKPEASGYSDRIKALERELELARQREQEYEQERQRQQGGKSRNRSRSRPRLQDRTPSRQDSWSRDEREVLKTQWDRHQEEQAAGAPAPSLPSRPLPDPRVSSPLKPQRTGDAQLPAPTLPLRPQRTGEARPLPGTPEKSKPPPGSYGNSAVKSPGSSGRPLPASPSRANWGNRTDRYLAKNTSPRSPPVQQTYSRELGAGAEQDAEDRRRIQSQAQTKAGGMAGKSLLEREMEMERQRQKEWEKAQEETASTPRSRDGVDGIGGGIGGRWDVGQWSGYTGGDSQNNVGTGIGAGRRQIVGPRPLPNRP